VKQGDVLARLDTTDLITAVKKAEVDLLSAQTRYEQTIAGASADDVAIAKNSVDTAQKNYETAQRNAQTDVATAEQSFAKVRSSFTAARTNVVSLTDGIRTDTAAYQTALGTLRTQLQSVRDLVDTLNGEVVKQQGGDLPAIKSALKATDAALAQAQQYASGTLQPVLTEYAGATDSLLAAVNLFERATSGEAVTSEATSATASFQTAQTGYGTASSKLTTSIDVPNASVSTALTSVTSALASFGSAPARDQVAAIQNAVTTEQQLATSIKSRLGQATTAIGGLADPIGGSFVSAQQAVTTAKDKAGQSVASQENALRSAQLSFQKTTATPKQTDIALSYASVQLAQLSLDKARADLENATLRAPVAGVVASVANGIGEAPAATFATIAVTSSLILHGTVGESDVAKLRMSQVATVTVDAAGIGTRLTGKIVTIDPVATISQGVPVYGVDVQIDLPDPAVRPGMSGTANVIVASAQGVLTVPNLAIRSSAGQRQIQVMRDGQAQDAQVEFGISNDTVTEIKSGLREGDTVVIPAARAATASARPGQQQFGPGGPPGVIIR
jgi:RND family efflux transporter MFP subunit